MMSQSVFVQRRYLIICYYYALLIKLSCFIIPRLKVFMTGTIRAYFCRQPYTDNETAIQQNCNKNI